MFQSGVRASPDFTTFINGLLFDVLRREQFLTKYKPFSHLNYAGYHEGSIFIKDKQRKLVAEIIFKDKVSYASRLIQFPIVSTQDLQHL